MSRSVGDEAERRAAQFLQTQGYTILHRNYAGRAGEIDLIAEEQGVLCFIEVRARAHSRYGYPEETITAQKKRRITITARQYLAAHRMEDRECRFDVIT